MQTEYREVLAPYINVWQHKLPLDKVLAAVKCSKEEYDLLVVLKVIGIPRWEITTNWKMLDYLDLLLLFNWEVEDIQELTGLSKEAINWRIFQTATPDQRREMEKTICYYHNERKLAPFQIAAVEGISLRSVKRVMDKYKLGEPNPPVLADDVRHTLSNKQLARLEGVDKRSLVLHWHKEGWEAKAIAERIGSTRAYVYRVLSDNNLKANKLDEASKKAEILRLHGEGLTVREIERIGYQRAYVYNVLNANGISANKVERDSSKKAEVLRLHGEGLTAKAIAEQVKVLINYVYVVLNEHGLKANKKPKQAITLSRWQTYRKESISTRDIILDCITKGDFRDGVENGINKISIHMGISKTTLVPIVTELLK